MRGGRTCTGAGHRRQPFTFYIGACNGGVWKTTDAGTTWIPIFDDQPTQSIGAIAIAPSDPERDLRRQRRRPAPARPLGGRRPLQVDRRRQDVDAPRASRRAADSRKSPIDPRNPDRLFVAVLGHPYGPNAERGVYRSTDGGKHVHAGAHARRERRRARRRHRSVEPEHRLRVDVGRAAGSVGERGLDRHERRRCSSRPTAARRGGRSRTGCRRDSSTSRSRSRRASRGACTRWSRAAARAAAAVAAAAAAAARRRLLSIRRRRRDLDAADDRQPRRRSARVRIEHRRLSEQSGLGDRDRHRHHASRWTAARRGRRSRARRAARTTRAAGSIQTTRTSSCSSSIRAPW